MAEPASGNVTSDSDGKVASSRQGSISTFKRKRLHGACDACRRKKTKCDSAIKPRNICSNCINSRILCTHETSRRKKRPETVQPSSLHLQALEDRLKTMEAYLQSVGHPRPIYDSTLQPILPAPPTSPVNGSPTTSLRIPSQLVTSATAFDLGHGRFHSRTTSSSSLIPLSPGAIGPLPVDENDVSDPDDLAHVTLAERLKNLSFDITENRFFGKSSMFLYAQNCMEFKNERSGSKDGNFARTKRPIFWELREWEREYLRIKNPNYSFPEPDLLESLMSLYFENIQIVYPVLHRPTFERDVRTKLHLRDPSFAATLLIVCAIASRFSTDPRVYLSENDDSSAGWKYISQIPLTSSVSLVHTTLYDLQRNALAAIYFQGSSMNHTAWNLAGLGLRLAQDSGLHRRQGARNPPPSKESELKKRAFWCLVAIDRTMSQLLGRPCALYAEDIDVDYPVECDDEYWETEDPSEAFRQPSDRPSVTTAFISYLRLCDLMGTMLRTLYSTKKCRILHGLVGEHWQVRVVAELDLALVAWKHSLAPHLQWNPETANRVYFNQAMWLHSAFCYARIQTHRPLLTSDSLISASFTLCRDEARICSEILEAANVRGGFINPNILMSAFASSLTLIIDLWAKREYVTAEEVTKSNASIESCLQYTRRAENRWHGAARMVDMLTEFRSVRSVHIQDNVGDTPQPVHPVALSRVPSHSSLQQPDLMNHNGYPLKTLTGDSVYSTPSPQQDVQDLLSTGLNLAEIPQETPFNFDFSNLQSQLGLNGATTVFPQQHNENMDQASLFSHEHHSSPPPISDGSGHYASAGTHLEPEGSSTLWNQAPIAYSIEEWDNYIASLERFGAR